MGPSEAVPAAPSNPRPRAGSRRASRGALLAVAGWVAAAFAAVFVAGIPFDPGEAVCGVWGCFPPLPAVAALHLFWCVALSASVWAIARWRPWVLRPIGFVLLLASVAGTATFVGNDLLQWLSAMPVEYRHFWPKRVAYRVLTLTDVPLLQSALAGVFCIVRGRSIVVSRS
jgi:hypothetical protein